MSSYSEGSRNSAVEKSITSAESRLAAENSRPRRRLRAKLAIAHGVHAVEGDAFEAEQLAGDLATEGNDGRRGAPAPSGARPSEQRARGHAGRRASWRTSTAALTGCARCRCVYPGEERDALLLRARGQLADQAGHLFQRQRALLAHVQPQIRRHLNRCACARSAACRQGGRARARARLHRHVDAFLVGQLRLLPPARAPMRRGILPRCLPRHDTRARERRSGAP